MEDEELKMTGQKAIEYVADFFGVPSMYALSKALSDEKLTVQPIQIKRYIEGSRMSKKVADRFYETYGIIITDSFYKENWARSRND